MQLCAFCVLVLACLVVTALAVDGLNPAYPSSKYPTGHETLFVVADQGVSQEDIVTYETLAGALSRTTPQLYRCVLHLACFHPSFPISLHLILVGR